MLLGLQEIEEGALFGVIRAGRIAGRGTDPTIPFPDEVLDRELFGSSIAPVVAGLLVQQFGEAFGEAVG